MNTLKFVGLLVCLSLTACQTPTTEDPQTHESLEDVLRVLHAYGINETMFDEDFDTWLDRLQGRDGTSVVELVLLDDGLLQILTCDGVWHDVGIIPRLTPEFRWQDSHLQWHLGDEGWETLLSLSDLPEGSPGETGKDGREIVFEIVEGTLKWQYLGSDTWQPLIDLDSLRGLPGEAGSALELRIEEDWLEWKPLSDHDWQPLLELTTLTGPRGPRGFEGIPGLSAYELYLKHHPESTLSETQWAKKLGPQEAIKTIFTSVATLHAEATYTEAVTFQGVLTHLFEDGYFLSDGRAHIKVINPFHQDYRLGDLLEVTGHYMVDDGHWHLTHLTQETLIRCDQGIDQPLVSITLEDIEALNPYDKLNYGRHYKIQAILDEEGSIISKNMSTSALSFPFDLLEVELSDAITQRMGQEVWLTFSLERRVGPTHYQARIITMAPVLYTVQLVSSFGDKMDDLTLENGLFKHHLPELTEVDYKFKGWFLDEDFTTPLTFKDRLTEDLTLYALWAEKHPWVCEYDALSISEVMSVPLGTSVTVFGVVTSLHGFENTFYLQDENGQSIMVGHFNHMPSIKTVNVGDCVVVTGDRMSLGQPMVFYASVLDILSTDHPIHVIDHLTMEDVIEGYHEYVNHRIILNDVMIEAIEGNTVYLRNHQEDGPRLKLDVSHETAWPDDGMTVGTVLSQLEFTLHREQFDNLWIVGVQLRD